MALELTPALVVPMVQFLQLDLRLKMTVNWVIDKFILTVVLTANAVCEKYNYVRPTGCCKIYKIYKIYK